MQLKDPEPSPYRVEPGRVRFRGETIHRADPATFVVLNWIWAKDKDNVYGVGRRITTADPLSFRALNAQFAKDKGSVYYVVGRFAKADPSSFEALDDGFFQSDWGTELKSYARDKGNVFFHDWQGQPKVVKGAHPRDFRPLEHGFARDESSVYCWGRRIPQAELGSFHKLGYRYSTDGKRVFFLDSEIKGADPRSFRIVDEFLNRARDDASLYEGGRSVTEFPPDPRRR